MGSLARWGKADPAFFAAFEQYFYHKQGLNQDEDEDVDEYYDEPEEDEEAE
jgi:hypothetical protein